MAGKGPAPKAERFRRNTPTRGEWQPSPEGGWQHDLPEPPSGLLPASERTWDSWFRSWWAGHWTLDDVAQLRFVIRLYDRVSRGDVKRLAELRQWMADMGITPKGQQDRRWTRPAPPAHPQRWSSDSRHRRLRVTDDAEPYAHLRVTEDGLDARQRYNLKTYGTAEPSVRQRFGRTDAERRGS